MLQHYRCLILHLGDSFRCVLPITVSGAVIRLIVVYTVISCAEQYLQSPFQLEHACELLLNSELFAFHSERMCEILADGAQSVSNVSRHSLLPDV
jgi:hypothetical protein